MMARRAKVAALPDIGKTMARLLEAGVNVGRTTAGNIAVALDLANNVEGKNIVTLLYDRQDKYDTPMPD